MRRFAAIAAVAAMTACMTVPMMAVMPASAADPTYTLTIKDNGNVDVANHTFEVYQIFTGDLSEGTLSNIAWGADVNGGSGFVAALQDNATLNAISQIAALTEDASASTVAAALAEVKEADAVDELAKVIAGLVDDSPTKSVTGGTIDGLAAGYYFVQDASTSGTGANDAKTKFILEVVKDVEVDIKTDAPTLEKKIWHNDDAAAPEITVAAPTISDTTPANGWNDVGDNQIGDTVYFLTKTAVPDMSDYDTYKYIIHDTMADGFTLDTTPVTKIVYVPETGTAVEIPLANVDVQVNGQSFTVDFGDLKKDITAAGGYIYTYYDAVLNEKALISDSANNSQYNANTAYLEYSNNPNASGEGDTNNTGLTEEDTVYDWTFTFNVTKVDGEGNAVGGAGFTLTDANGTTVGLIEVTSVSNVNISAADDTKYYRVAKEGETATTTEILTTVAQNKFVILGLDDTVAYTLTETTTPGGYNDCDPVAIQLASGYNSTGLELTSLKNGNDVNAETVINNKGSVLPSTGGIGTTLFYVVGGTLVAGAGVTLIAKKRMKKED